MPLKGEAKRQANKAWMRRAKQTGYTKWLYDRRKLRFDDADAFRAALLEIKNGDEPVAAALARKALNASARRERKLGPSPKPGFAPKTNGKHDDGMSLAEALKQLGL